MTPNSLYLAQVLAKVLHTKIIIVSAKFLVNEISSRFARHKVHAGRDLWVSMSYRIKSVTMLFFEDSALKSTKQA